MKAGLNSDVTKVVPVQRRKKTITSSAFSEFIIILPAVLQHLAPMYIS